MCVSECVCVFVCVYLIAVSPDAHQKVVRLYISMDEVLVVDVLNSPNHLHQMTIIMRSIILEGGTYMYT